MVGELGGGGGGGGGGMLLMILSKVISKHFEAENTRNLLSSDMVSLLINDGFHNNNNSRLQN